MIGLPWREADGADITYTTSSLDCTVGVWGEVEPRDGSVAIPGVVKHTALGREGRGGREKVGKGMRKGVIQWI